MNPKNQYLTMLGWTAGITLGLGLVLWLFGSSAQADASYDDPAAGLWQLELAGSLWSGGTIAFLLWLAARGIVEQLAYKPEPVKTLADIEKRRKDPDQPV